jgi:hypothetical protein
MNSYRRREQIFASPATLGPALASPGHTSGQDRRVTPGQLVLSRPFALVSVPNPASRAEARDLASPTNSGRSGHRSRARPDAPAARLGDL